MFGGCGEAAQRAGDAQSRATLWWLTSGLDLWSNFQYCLNDFAANGNCDNGDQFKQAERRQAGGLTASHAVPGRWGKVEVESDLGKGSEFAIVLSTDPSKLDRLIQGAQNAQSAQA